MACVRNCAKMSTDMWLLRLRLGDHKKTKRLLNLNNEECFQSLAAKFKQQMEYHLDQHFVKPTQSQCNESGEKNVKHILPLCTADLVFAKKTGSSK